MLALLVWLPAGCGGGDGGGGDDLPAEQVRPDGLEWVSAAVGALEEELVARHGEAQRERARRGLAQVAAFWRLDDGTRGEMEDFVRVNFAGDRETLDSMFARFQELLEQLDGHMLEISLSFKRQSDLDLGPIYPFDEAFAGYDPAAHVSDDLFGNRLGFVVLLNFPLTTLEQRLTEGESWSRRRWAEARLAQRFSRRIPGDVALEQARVRAVVDQYIAEYNIWMHHLVDDDGRRLFPEGMRLLAHWNLRDELKANYAAGEDGEVKQRMIQRVMERIVDQSIPEVVVNSPHVDWNPFTNEVRRAEVSDSEEPAPTNLEVTSDPEPDTRYRMLFDTYLAARLADPYTPNTPTHIARRFDEDREIPEERVEEMFEQLLSSPLLVETGQIIEERLGRPLEPFDIWYNGFQARGEYDESQLDRIVSARYPGPAAYERDMTRMLVSLGWGFDDARALADRIVVEPARGSGHAWGAGMRGADSHLRTRVGPGGMDYKGYNIAVHEMGHNVEQTISLYGIDYYTLAGVPNTAFTEALAFVFQARDFDLLGLESADVEARALRALDDYWGAAEIAAVSLVDMRVWHWMYDHPDATSSELKEATLDIARDVWNQYYAPITGVEDVTLLAIYSHMIHSWLYLPDYPIGHMIAVQVEEQIERSGEVGPEFERMALTGNVVPDLWMREATGSPVGPEAMLAAAERALDTLR
jgi:hypothetical protein